MFAVGLAVFTVGVLTAGPVADRRGARLLIGLAAATGGGGLLLAASLPTLPAMLGGVGVSFGAANGMGYASALHVAGTGWQTRRGLAIGIVLSAYALGAVLAAPLLAVAVEAAGWRATLAGWGAVVGLLVGVAAVLVPGRDPASPLPERQRGRPAGVAQVALLWVVFGACSAPTLFTFAHGAAAAGARGLSLQAAGAAVAVLSGGNLAGRLAAGWAADRFGSVRCLLAVTVTAVAGYGALAGIPGAGVVMPVFLLVGGTYGAVSALVPAATADVVGPGRLAGTYGKVFLSWGLAGLTAPVAGGWLVERTGRYDAAFLAGALVAAVAVAGAGGLRRAGG